MRGSVIARIVAATVVSIITLTGCGGGGGGGDTAPAPTPQAPPAGTVDTTPPTVLSSAPASNSNTASGNSTVAVNFSEAVTGATTTSMRVSANGVALPGTVTQNVNRLTATFTPAGPLACGIAHTVQLTSGIADLAGNALAPTSWSFGVKPIGAWPFVDGNAGTGINKTKTLPGVTPRIVSLNSKLYAAWAEGASGQIRVAVMTGTDAAPVWQFVDGNDPVFGINRTPGQVGATPSLAVHNGRLFAAWAEF
ncbi:MAG: Ig-like domain-containing protein, partial [Burkholderiales bacterium]